MFYSEYEALFQQYNTAIRNYCYIRTGDGTAAADCTQEVFMILYKKMNKVRATDKTALWLYRTADKVMSRYWKKQRPNVSLDEVADVLPAEEVPAGESYDMLNEILKKEELELLEAYYIYGSTVRELAQKYGISEAAVYKRIERLKARIARHKEGLL